MKRFIGFGVKTLLEAKVEETEEKQRGKKKEKKSFTELASEEIRFYNLFFLLLINIKIKSGVYTFRLFEIKYSLHDSNGCRRLRSQRRNLRTVRSL